MNQLRDEKTRLKRLVAKSEPSQRDAPGRVLKIVLKPAAQRHIAGFNRSYRAKQNELNDLLRVKIKASQRCEFDMGYRGLAILLRRDGFHLNDKRVHRLYRLEGSSLRTKVTLSSTSPRAHCANWAQHHLKHRLHARSVDE